MDSLRGYMLFLMLLTVKATDGHNVKLHSLNPSIPFPLAHPTMYNVFAICHNSTLRPHYTKEMLPSNGFGYLHRQASAINQLESWFTVCCSNSTQDEELTLCCAQQAWEKSLIDFCEEEFGIKTSHYHCCKKSGKARWDCFREEAPDPLYQLNGQEVPHERPTMIEGFVFVSSSCHKTRTPEITPRPQMETDIGQKMVGLQIPLFLGVEGQHVSSARSMRPPIPFPLARPTPANILAICKYSKQRPLYPKETLPESGFDYLHRQASAINQLESWYTVCCANSTEDDNIILCCAQQAWEKSLSAFCKEEFSIKTNHYHCCKLNGAAKWACFEKKASNKLYLPSGHERKPMPTPTNQAFYFDASSCQKTRNMTEMIKTAQIFPPGRPNSQNIEPICAFHKNRPRYLTSCLPSTGFHWFTLQIKAINGLEKGFGQCCKANKDIQTCAEAKWKKMVDRFCKDEKKIQLNPFECCKKQRRKEQYDCFSSASPNPDYMVMNEYAPIEVPLSLDMFCDVYPALQKMNRVPFSVDEMAIKCCILVVDERSACLQMQLDNLVDDTCKAGDPSLAKVQQNCCKKTPKGRAKCFSNLLLHNIAKAKLANSNRKICPLIY